MANSNGMREVLMKEFAENYMEPLYYFCLKKTGDSYEAWEMPEYLGMSQNGAGNPDTMYWQYIPEATDSSGMTPKSVCILL